LNFPAARACSRWRVMASLKTNFINYDTMLTAYILCQIEREKTIGVVQSKKQYVPQGFLG
jgi:hypothetical protein